MYFGLVWILGTASRLFVTDSQRLSHSHKFIAKADTVAWKEYRIETTPTRHGGLPPFFHGTDQVYQRLINVSSLFLSSDNISGPVSRLLIILYDKAIEKSSTINSIVGIQRKELRINRTIFRLVAYTMQYVGYVKKRMYLVKRAKLKYRIRPWTKDPFRSFLNGIGNY